MKTFKKTIDTPRLEIRYSDYPDHPRQYADNCTGTWVNKVHRYLSPDGSDCDEYHAMMEAEGCADNMKGHMDEIKRILLEEYDKNVVHIFPISRYEHSGIAYQLGEYHGWDTGPCGFYIMTDEDVERFKNCYDTDNIEDIKKQIQSEIDEYNHYANGEILEYTLYDENGEIKEWGGGYTDIDQIQSDLCYIDGIEWANEDMDEYFIR